MTYVGDVFVAGLADTDVEEQEAKLDRVMHRPRQAARLSASAGGDDAVANNA